MLFVHDQKGLDSKIICPCLYYCNIRILSQAHVEDHLHIKEIISFYTQWIYHGEKTELVINKSRIGDHHDVTTTIDNVDEEDEELQDMLEDITSADIMDTNSTTTYHDRATHVDTNVEREVENFNKLLVEA